MSEKFHMFASTRRSFLLGAMAATVGFASMGYAEATGGAISQRKLVKPPLLGDPAAPNRFEIWGSYTCPFTAQLLPILQDIVTRLPEIVSLEWHHFPTHPPDPALHVAGLAFEGEHFWGYSSRILREVLSANGDHTVLTPGKLAELVLAEGGSAEVITAAYADQSKWDAVKADLIAGKLLGVSMTPGLFYGGYFLTPQGLPLDNAAFHKSLYEMVQKGAMPVSGSSPG